MTKLEICQREAVNDGKVFLYPEGMFYKAYDRSAFILCQYVYPFKVSARPLKGLDGPLLSVGFPQSSLSKYLGLAQVFDSQDINDRCKMLILNQIPDMSGFDAWKASFFPIVPAHPDSTHTPSFNSLPVYGDAYRLVMDVTVLCGGLDRRFRYSLGEDIRSEAKRMLLAIVWAGKGEDRLNNISLARHTLADVQICLRLLNDLRVVPDKRYVPFLDQTENISKQLSNWERSERRQRNCPARVPPPSEVSAESGVNAMKSGPSGEGFFEADFGKRKCPPGGRQSGGR